MHLAERLTGSTSIGVLRAAKRVIYDEGHQQELVAVHAAASLEDLDEFLHSGESWSIS